MVQLAGHDMLKAKGVGTPDRRPRAPSARRVAQFEKATTVAKLAAARKRKRVANGKCEGRKAGDEASAGECIGQPVRDEPGCRGAGQGAGAQEAQGRLDEPAGYIRRVGQAGLPERARHALQPMIHGGEEGAMPWLSRRRSSSVFEARRTECASAWLRRLEAERFEP
jgi:hypothetical protein